MPSKRSYESLMVVDFFTYDDPEEGIDAVLKKLLCYRGDGLPEGTVEDFLEHVDTLSGALAAKASRFRTLMLNNHSAILERPEYMQEVMEFIDKHITDPKEKQRAIDVTKASLKDRYQAHQGFLKKMKFKDPEVQEGWCSLRPCKEWFYRFTLPKEVGATNKKRRATSLVTKQEAAYETTWDELDKVHALCLEIIMRALISPPVTEQEKWALFAAIAFCTGRRPCEILGSRMVMELLPDQEFIVRVWGLAKKGGFDDNWYEIPVLCPGTNVVRALDILRGTGLHQGKCSRTRTNGCRPIIGCGKYAVIRGLYVVFGHAVRKQHGFQPGSDIALYCQKALCHTGTGVGETYRCVNVTTHLVLRKGAAAENSGGEDEGSDTESVMGEEDSEE